MTTRKLVNEGCIGGQTFNRGDLVEIQDNAGEAHNARITKIEQIPGTTEGQYAYNFDYYCVDDPDLDGFSCDELPVLEGAPTEFEFYECTPRRLFETSQLTEAMWLAARQRGVTGTDMAAIIGESKYKTSLDVYMDKITPIDEQERIDNDHMWLGREMEDVVAKRFQQETGLKLINQHAVLQHPEYEWMLANIDRKVVGEKAIVELKIANAMFSKKEWGESGTDHVPTNYLIQVYHYMIVCGVRTGYLGVIFTDTREFRWYKFELIESFAASLIEQSYDFWMNNVCADVAPAPTNADDLSTLYPVDNLPSVVATEEMQTLCVSYEHNRQAIQRLQKANDDLSLEVGQFIGEHRELMTNQDKKVLARFNTASGRNSCDFKKLEREFPDAFEACVKKSEPKRTVKMNWRVLKSITEEA